MKNKIPTIFIVGGSKKIMSRRISGAPIDAKIRLFDGYHGMPSKHCQVDFIVVITNFISHGKVRGLLNNHKSCRKVWARDNEINPAFLNSLV